MQVMKARLLCLWSAAAVSACSTAGQRLDAGIVDGFEPGITTSHDALARLGPPTSQRELSDGQRVLQWGEAPQPSSGEVLPRVAIVFDRSGRMQGAIWRPSGR